ncbi:MAG: CoA-binding protein [Candidatus Helarchaeota archaeon]
MKKEKPGLDVFFKPKNVAVVGVSRNTRKFGHVIFRNFIDSNIEIDVYPVNPNLSSVLGYKCYNSILDIPSSIDLVIIAVGRHLVLNTIKQCAQKGVRGVIIIAGGFAEIGEEGKKIENEIKKQKKEKLLLLASLELLALHY